MGGVIKRHNKTFLFIIKDDSIAVIKKSNGYNFIVYYKFMYTNHIRFRYFYDYVLHERLSSLRTESDLISLAQCYHLIGSHGKSFNRVDSHELDSYNKTYYG